MGEEVYFVGSVWVVTEAVVGTAEAAGDDDIGVVEAEEDESGGYSGS